MNPEQQDTRRSAPRRRRWLRGATLAAVLLGAVLLLAVLWLLYSPRTLQTVLEKSLSAVSGLTIAYDHLSLDPAAGEVQIEGLQISPGRSRPGFRMAIPRMHLQYRLTGSLADRVLILEQVRLQDPDLQLGPRFRLPAPPGASRQPGGTGAFFQWSVRAVLFSQVQLRNLAVSGGHLQLQTGTATLRLSDLALHLEDFRQLKLQAKPSVQWPQSRLAAEADGVDIDLTGRSDGDIDGRFRIRAGRVDTGVARAEALSMEIDAAGRPGTGELRVEAARLTARVAFPDSPARSISLTGRGGYRMSAAAAEISHWHLTVADFLEASGDADWNPAGGRGFGLRIRSARVDTAAAKTFLENRLGQGLADLDLSGPLMMEGRVDGSPAAPLPSWRMDSTWILDGVRMGIRQDSSRIHGRLGGRVRLSGALLDPVSDFRLVLATENLDLFGVRMRAVRTEITGQGPWRRPDITATADIAELTLGDGNRYGLHRIRLRAENGHVNMAGPSLDLPMLAATSAELGRFRGSLHADANGIDLDLESPEAGLPHLAADWRLVPPDWQVQARDRLGIIMHWRPGDRPGLNARLEVADLGLASPDNRILAEKVRVSAALDCRMSGTAAEVTLSATASAGEVLWQRYYLDLAGSPLAVTGRTSYRPSRGELVFEKWELSLPPQLEIDASGSFTLDPHPPSAHFAIQAADTPLAPLVDRWLIEPYRFDYPSLESLETGGLVSAALEVRWSASGWTVTGDTSLRRGHIRDPHHDLRLEGIDLDLPIWRTPVPPATNTHPRQGSLSVSQLTLPHLPPQPLAAALAVEPNRIGFPQPIRLGLKSGRVTLGATNLSNVYGPELRLESSLRFDDVGLGPFLEPIWPQLADGRLNGQLTEVHYREGKFTTRGTLQAEIFGGRIELSRIGLARPFAAITTLTLDADLRSLHLDAMTAGTSFGKIEGVLEGAVRNLEIVRGQPQRFDLLLETVPRPGVDQTINIRAVENIARIGGGQSPFMGLAGVMGALFKEFRYRKIGVRASLENDIFHINGTIRENGTEYLVKSGGLPGVDVINSNPDNRIRFKDMVKRIQRIGSNSAEPVIQ